MNEFEEIILTIAGFVAGLIDSVAGGGGLITVPLLSILLEPGAVAVGTNKMAAVCSSLFALLVYMRAGHVRLRGNLIFALVTGLGAIAGALTAPLIPKEAFKLILITICPLMLWLVFRKDLWVRRELEEAPNHRETSRRQSWFWAAGLVCGFYDGVAGPGGGTLMFLSLFLIARLPLLNAIATAKVANLSSASLSLASYAVTGHVLWSRGVWLALGISFGAGLGALVAGRRAGPIARAALLVVASLLLLRLIFL